MNMLEALNKGLDLFVDGKIEKVNFLNIFSLRKEKDIHQQERIFYNIYMPTCTRAGYLNGESVAEILDELKALYNDFILSELNKINDYYLVLNNGAVIERY